ncbi:penicillin-binding transpeptidase domain-containing protein [Pseudarthrobacter siccitolerans]|uniref:penicillin-binding transpeptidase domain-containing protein n=1 Tax=Pseudarthrobacter siccitolerans TaxID=861266 RepID=UPI00358FBC18
MPPPSKKASFRRSRTSSSRRATRERAVLQGLVRARHRTPHLRRGHRLIDEHRHCDRWPGADQTAALRLSEEIRRRRETGIPLPGESSGLLAPPDKWDGRQEFAVLFGQGVSQTPLQTTMAFQAIANDGVLLKPQLIESYIDPDGAEHPVQTEPGTRAVSESTARQTRDILESVVTAGGAKDIKVPGYRVGGKTGTAEAVADDGIGLDGYTASFVGMAPMDDPEYVVMVNVQRPQGNIYGISTAPVFNNIMGRALTRFNVEPSRTPSVSLPQEY